MAVRTHGSPSNSALTPAATRVTPRLLRALTRRLVKETKPEQIYLFGSYAYGEPKPYSDLDLMIVTEEPRGATRNERNQFVNEKTLAALRELSTMDFDVVARTPRELMQRLEEGHPFDREIVLRGHILYARRGSPPRYHAKRWRNRMPDSKVVEEWVERAEGDYYDALQILRRRKHQNPPSVCFHCQQSTEKYLKAFLLKTRGGFQHTHKLEELNQQCAEEDGTFLMIHDLVEPLTKYAISGRYPDSSITMDEARQAVARLKQIRKFILPKLGIK